MDYFFYSGSIERGHDLDFIRLISEKKNSDDVTVILTTLGGSPDAAYKIGRYLQQRYSDVTIFVPGLCKSAGTLLAIAANQIVFSPYGELGPLDIQMSKQDNLMGMESGLNISEAFASMESRARESFHRAVGEIISGSGGVVSFAAAAGAASDMVGSMYGPIFSQIDPEEVGSRSRAMRIGESYGHRLNEKFKNLRDNGIEIISQSYPSHGFVIDFDEVSALFERVREANDDEKKLVEGLGPRCRFPEQGLHISCLTEEMAAIGKGDENEVDPTAPNGRSINGGAKHGKNPSGAGESERPASGKRPPEASSATPE